MRLSDLVLDQWTPLSHKEALGNRPRERGALAPSWVGEHFRRLTAYKLLLAYQKNAARFFLPGNTADRDFHNRREYGDAALIVHQIRGAVLGDDQTISVEGAEPEGTDAQPDAAAVERQDWLRQWATDERLALKLIEREEHTVGLGDGVMLFAWSNKAKRVRVTVYDPGFYFPVLDDSPGDDYPGTIHLAWELDRVDLDGAKHRYVRRITYRLGPIMPALDALGQFLVGADGRVTLRDGDTVDDQGRIVRRLPYQAPEDDPASVTCYLTDATWKLGEGTDRLDDFDPTRATYATNEDGDLLRDLDLGFDFIPILHLPNTVAGAAHYGSSALETVLQILDDLQGTDTDTQATAGILGSPPIALSGSSGDDLTTYGPGTVFRLGENGRLDVIDTSHSLDALLKLKDSLLKRLSVNSRVPESVLGRLDSGAVTSGVMLALTFGPLTQFVREMRLVREEKNALALKFVQRLAIIGGVLQGPVLPANIVPGSYLPSDRAGVVAEVRQLLTVPAAISTHTAVRMLTEAGFPIDDAQAEVERIQHENYAAAVELLAATGDEATVFEYLGLQPPAPAPPKPIVVNPPPPAGA